MWTSLYQEFYKMNHKKVTWFAPIIMFFLMIFLGVAMGHSEERLLVMTCYGSSEWILLVLVIVGSTLFSMEFQNNAILTLLYKTPSKINVYFSKLTVLFTYNVLLHVLAMVFTVILQLTSLNDHVSWLAIYQYKQPLIVNMFATTGIDLLTSILIISLIFLTSCLINVNSVVITLNIAIVFMGQNMSADLLNANSKLAPLVKWNPLNMCNLTTQYYNYPVYHDLSMLSNLQLIMGTLTYTVLFFLLGYLVFRKKRF